MLQINETGKIRKWIQGQGAVNVKCDEVSEKEILVTIAAKFIALGVC